MYNLGHLVVLLNEACVIVPKLVEPILETLPDPCQQALLFLKAYTYLKRKKELIYTQKIIFVNKENRYITYFRHLRNNVNENGICAVN